MRKRFHRAVAVVPASEAENRQESPLVPLAFDEGFQLVAGPDSNVQVAVRSHDNAVVAALNAVVRRQLVCLLHARFAVRRTVRRQPVHRVQNLLPLVSGTAL